jgi:hypothetical protein
MPRRALENGSMAPAFRISAVFSLMPGAVFLPVFRAAAVSWAAGKYPAHETESGVVFAARPDFAAASAAAAIDAAFHAANATVAATVATAYAAAAFWSAVSIDATRGAKARQS